MRIKPLADSGDPYAMAMLAARYKWGEGVSQDYSQAETWYRKAAERGFSTAKYILELVKINGWPKTQSEQVQWLRKDAEAGVIAAQEGLGNHYQSGKGVPQNFSEAARWYERSSRGGNARSQYFLAFMYANGEGVPQDNTRAYAWINLAAAKLLPSAFRDLAVSYRDYWRTYLTLDQLSRAQEFTRSFEETQVQRREPSTPQPSKKEIISGTAFAVSRNGHLLTNQHIIEGCIEIKIKAAGSVATGTLVASDTANDLALLKVSSATPSVATFRSGRGVRPGDSILVIGFPLKGLLAEGPSVTTGTISALAGLGNDTRFIQITAPVQPGNSGGPLLDKAGNVVGIVVAKLDALRVAAITGDIPQNVNFAINARVAQTFLDANGVDYETGPSITTLEPADIAEGAKQFTVSIECLK